MKLTNIYIGWDCVLLNDTLNQFNSNGILKKAMTSLNKYRNFIFYNAKVYKT